MAAENKFPNPCKLESKIELEQEFDLKTLAERVADGLVLGDEVEFVQFEMCGLNGESLCKLIPRDRVKGFLRTGLNAITFTSFFGVGGTITPLKLCCEGGYRDGLIFGDESTFVERLPWSKGKVGRIICEPYMDGMPVPSWRYNCRRLLDDLERQKQLLFKGAFEYEFTAYHESTGEPVTTGLDIFSTIRNNFDEELMLDCSNMLKKMGIQINTMNGEYAPGQQEWTMAPSWGIEVADQAFDFRNSIKQIFKSRGYNATFMTRVEDGSAGCFNGGHFNFSLWYDHETCAFWDEENECLSKIGQYALGGLMKHASTLVGISAATPVDYVRLKPHTFAPCNASWGFENRTCLIRVKTYDNKRSYFEVRCGSSMTNPYLLQAACIAAALDGINNEIVPPPPVANDAGDMEELPKIPQNVEEGTAAVENNETLKKLFETPYDEAHGGGNLLDMFVQVKRTEAKAMQDEEGNPDWAKMKALCFQSI